MEAQFAVASVAKNIRIETQLVFGCDGMFGAI